MLAEQIQEYYGDPKFLSNREKTVIMLLKYIRENIINDNKPHNGQDIFNGYMASIYLYETIKVIGNIIRSTKYSVVRKLEDGYKQLDTSHPVSRTLDDLESTFDLMWMSYAIHGCALLSTYDTGPTAHDKRLIHFDNNTWIADYSPTVHGQFERPIGFHIKILNAFEKNDYPEFIPIDNAIYVQGDIPLGGTYSIVETTLLNTVSNKDHANKFIAWFQSDLVTDLAKEMWDQDYRPLRPDEVRKYQDMFEMMWFGYSGELRQFSSFNQDKEVLVKVSMFMGLDRELIVQPIGGTISRWGKNTNRAIADAVIPLLKKFKYALIKDLPLDDDIDIKIDMSWLKDYMEKV